ncbi:MAG TPA: hypothetical protein VFB04_15660 [Terriglobales bacterium]|nr:hypothetical protein [Terriglobales bacterium]
MSLPLHRLVVPIALLASALPISASAQQSIGELYATDASVKGSVILAGSGTTVLSGSSIQAGAQAATLKLERGGSLLVCQGTKLAVTTSKTGRELLFSLNTGNLELNYPLGTEADTLLTPDLRLVMPGPGTVHVAVRVTPQGDTCVQSLPWNVAAITISETMGDATYQVKPDEAVVFQGGHLNDAVPSRQNCGCPTSVPVQVAQARPPAPPPPKPAEAPATTAARPAPPDQHLAMEAPFIFHGSEPLRDLGPNVAMLRLEHNQVFQLEPAVLPPASKPKKHAAKQNTEVARKQPSHGFFAKLGSFFASIFH